MELFSIRIQRTFQLVSTGLSMSQNIIWGIMFLLLCGRMSQENIATGLRYLIKEGVDICRFLK